MHMSINKGRALAWIKPCQLITSGFFKTKDNIHCKLYTCTILLYVCPICDRFKQSMIAQYVRFCNWPNTSFMQKEVATHGTA